MSKIKGKGGKSPARSAQLGPELQQVFSLAMQMHQQGRLQEAVQGYQQVLQQQPEHADSLHLLGVLAHQTGNNESAMTLILEAIRLNPGQGHYLYNLGKVYQAEGRLSEATRCYRDSVKLNAANADAWSNLGTAYQDQGQYPQAVQAYKQAIKLPEQNSSALANLGTLLMHNGDLLQAEKYFSRLLVSEPLNAEVRSKLAQIRLRKGDFTAGWRDYLWQNFSPAFTDKNPARIIPFPLWNGQPLTGKTLLLRADLGVGDVVMNLSCVGELCAQAGRVIIECEERFVPLIRRSFPQVQCLLRSASGDISWHKAMGGIDFQANLSDLPVYLRPDVATFPAVRPWLKPDQAVSAAWKTRLSQLGEGLKVGISWSGGVGVRVRNWRSVALQHWQPLAAIAGVHLVSLQYGDCQQEIAAFNRTSASTLHSFADMDAIKDVDGFAALVSALDLVISIDNSTVHFAGALGVPVWILLPFAAEWRWLTEREDSLWYQSARLFRPKAAGSNDMNRQIRTVSKELTAMAAGGYRQSTADQQQTTDDIPAGAESLPVLESFSGSAGYVLFLNDDLAWGHWGHSLGSLAVHEKLREDAAAVVSLPVPKLCEPFFAESIPELLEDDAQWEIFCQKHPSLVALLAGAELIVINGADTTAAGSLNLFNLFYLSWAAVSRLGRRAVLVNQAGINAVLDQSAPLSGMYRKLLAVLNADARPAAGTLPACIEQSYKPGKAAGEKPYVLISGHAGCSESYAATLLDLTDRLHAAGVGVKLLTGARAFLDYQDSAYVQLLASRIGSACELVLARSEQEWLQQIDRASLLISGKADPVTAALCLSTPVLLTEDVSPAVRSLVQQVGESAALVAGAGMDAGRLYDCAMDAVSGGAPDTSARQKILEMALENLSFRMVQAQA